MKQITLYVCTECGGLHPVKVLRGEEIENHPLIKGMYAHERHGSDLSIVSIPPCPTCQSKLRDEFFTRLQRSFEYSLFELKEKAQDEPQG